jgi:hypothetical protein
MKRQLQAPPPPVRVTAARSPSTSVNASSPERTHLPAGEDDPLAVLAADAREHAATMLTDEQVATIKNRLEKVRGSRGALSSIAQRGLHSNRVLRQLLEADEEPSLVRDVILAELQQLGEDAQTTVDAVGESGVQLVLEEQRENLMRLGAAVPLEDLLLLRMLGASSPEQSLAVALARARRDLSAQERRRMAHLLGMDMEEETLGPIPDLEPFQLAPKYVLEHVVRIEKTAEPPIPSTPWKGIFKILQGTVLGAANLAMGLSVAVNPAVIFGVTGSVAGCLGSLGEGVDELVKARPAPPTQATKATKKGRL